MRESRKLIIASVLQSLEKLGFPIGGDHRLSIFNANAKFYVLMGTVADIKKADRSVDIENFLEKTGDEWMLKLLVREPVKLVTPVIEEEDN